MSALISNLKSLIGDMSNVQFARKVGLSEAVIRKILGGGSPNLVTLGKIARACNVRMSWLVGDSPIDLSNDEGVFEFESESPIQTSPDSVKPNVKHSNAAVAKLDQSTNHEKRHFAFGDGGAVNQSPGKFLPSTTSSGVNNSLLTSCFKACEAIYTDDFTNLSVIAQMEVSTKLYNLILSFSDGLSIPITRFDNFEDPDYLKVLQILICLNLMPKTCSTSYCSAF